MKNALIPKHYEIDTKKNPSAFQMVSIFSENFNIEFYLMVATISLFDTTYCIMEPVTDKKTHVVFTFFKEFLPNNTVMHYIPLKNPYLVKFILSIYEKVSATNKSMYISYKDSTNKGYKYVLIDSMQIFKSKFDLIASISPLGHISLNFYKKCFRVFPKFTKLHTHIKINSKTINDNLFSTIELIFQLNNGLYPHKKGKVSKLPTY